MKKLFIVANWKSHKTEQEAKDWFAALQSFDYSEAGLDHKEIIVCPPLPLLYTLKSLITTQNTQNLPLRIGSQNISPFDDGAYTGEVSANMLKDAASYVIIGHSERRNYFAENDELLSQKVEQAVAQDITPIFCVQGKDTPVPKQASFIAYEPVFAIGSGTPDTPESAESVAAFFKEQAHTQQVIYGGSVKPENVNAFTQMPHIDGVLPGGASLDAASFYQIIVNA